jgi:hypothetical protein
MTSANDNTARNLYMIARFIVCDTREGRSVERRGRRKRERVSVCSGGGGCAEGGHGGMHGVQAQRSPLYMPCEEQPTAHASQAAHPQAPPTH